MKMLNKLRWHRIGYVEGRVKRDETCTLTARSVLFVREPFLWFKTRKAVEIGDHKTIKCLVITSPSLRQYRKDVADWLLGGNIQYVSDNGTNRPAEIVRLVPTTKEGRKS